MAVARLVLYEKIGPGPHACHWCGDPINWKLGLVAGALIADHLDWDRCNDAVENVVPSCMVCNSCRTRDRDRDRIQGGELTVLRSGRPTRAVERTCEHCGGYFLTIPAEVRIGKGRFCSRSCARSNPRTKRAA